MQHNLNIDHSGHVLGVQRVQTIPEDVLKAYQDIRDSQQRGEVIRIASLPVAWIESKMAQGYPILDMPAAEIIALLRRDGMEHFIQYKGSV